MVSTLSKASEEGPEMTMPDAVERYFAGWIARDADAVLAALTERGTYEDPTTGGPVSGAAFRGYMGASGRPSPI
jgi:hypothetical protein